MLAILEVGNTSLGACYTARATHEVKKNYLT